MCLRSHVLTFDFILKCVIGSLAPSRPPYNPSTNPPSLGSLRDPAVSPFVPPPNLRDRSRLYEPSVTSQLTNHSSTAYEDAGEVEVPADEASEAAAAAAAGTDESSFSSISQHSPRKNTPNVMAQMEALNIDLEEIQDCLTEMSKRGHLARRERSIFQKIEDMSMTFHF